MERFIRGAIMTSLCTPRECSRAVRGIERKSNLKLQEDVRERKNLDMDTTSEINVYYIRQTEHRISYHGQNYKQIFDKLNIAYHIRDKIINKHSMNWTSYIISGTKWYTNSTKDGSSHSRNEMQTASDVLWGHKLTLHLLPRPAAIYRWVECGGHL